MEVSFHVAARRKNREIRHGFNFSLEKALLWILQKFLSSHIFWVVV